MPAELDASATTPDPTYPASRSRTEPPTSHQHPRHRHTEHDAARLDKPSASGRAVTAIGSQSWSAGYVPNEHYGLTLGLSAYLSLRYQTAGRRAVITEDLASFRTGLSRRLPNARAVFSCIAARGRTVLMPRWVSWFHLFWSGSLIDRDVAVAG